MKELEAPWRKFLCPPRESEGWKMQTRVLSSVAGPGAHAQCGCRECLEIQLLVDDLLSHNAGLPRSKDPQT